MNFVRTELAPAIEQLTLNIVVLRALAATGTMGVSCRWVNLRTVRLDRVAIGPELTLECAHAQAFVVFETGRGRLASCSLREIAVHNRKLAEGWHGVKGRVCLVIRPGVSIGGGNCLRCGHVMSTGRERNVGDVRRGAE